MSNVPTTTNEIGGTIAAVPVRIVAGKSAIDEAGNVVESIPISIIAGTAATLPIVQLSTTTTTDELGRGLSVRPARIVAGATTTDSAGHVVDVIQVRDIGTGSITLGALTLSGALQIGTAASGTIIGATAGSTITGNIPGITVNSGARTYSGTPTGSGATITNGLVETLAGATNSPNNSSVTVAAAAVTLGTLTLSGSLKVGDATSGTIIGATAGSTIAGNIPGITVNSGARTYSGTPTGSAATISNGLVETLAGATNTPNSSSITVTATALPALANLVGHWDTTDLAVVADGTAVTSWTDRVNAQVLTSVVSPTYKNSVYGGKPSLRATGTQYMTSTGTQVLAALNSKDFTAIVVYGNVTATSFGFLFSATTSTGLNFSCSGTNAGSISGAETIPYAGAGFSTGTLASCSAGYFSGHGAQRQVYVNGSLVSQTSSTPWSIGNTAFSIFAGTAGANTAKADILKVLVWNRRLTIAEVVQVERALRDYYGQSYPWTTPGYYAVTTGDSITFGYGMTARSKAWPYLLAQGLSLPFGAWSNPGFIGANAVDILNIINAEQLTSLSSITGVPTKYTYMEFYNQRSNATNPISSSVALSTTRSVLNQIHTTAGDKVLFATTTDYASRGAEKGLWTAYWDVSGNRTGYMDAYIPLHTDTNLGVDLACPNSAPYGTYFSNALKNFTCNATVVNGNTSVTVNSVSSGSANMVAGASWAGTGIQAGTTIISGPGGGGVGTYVLSLAPTSGSTGTFTGGSGDGVHPGDAAGPLFVTAFQTAFAGM